MRTSAAPRCFGTRGGANRRHGFHLRLSRAWRAGVAVTPVTDSIPCSACNEHFVSTLSLSLYLFLCRIFFPVLEVIKKLFFRAILRSIVFKSVSLPCVSLSCRRLFVSVPIGCFRILRCAVKCATTCAAAASVGKCSLWEQSIRARRRHELAK